MENSGKSLFADTLQSIYRYTSESLLLIETKNGSLVVVCTAFIIGLLTVVQYTWLCCHLYLLILIALSYIVLSIGLLLSLWSFYPRNKALKNKPESDKDEQRKLTEHIYSTEHIYALGYEGLLLFLQQIDPAHKITTVDRALIHCTYHKASVSARKYKLFRAALVCALLGILFSLITVLLYIYC